MGTVGTERCSDHLRLSSLLICDPGIVQEKLLNDYLYRIFSSPDRGPPAATSRYGWVCSPSSLCWAGSETGNCRYGEGQPGLGSVPCCETCASSLLSGLLFLSPDRASSFLLRRAQGRKDLCALASGLMDMSLYLYSALAVCASA